ncbi:MAG: ribonuclease P protein component [Alphaproteobacteria bacterium]|nr:ribonuclease P protein component [Alphaproteobacteria bacterium]PPR14701.1 MAG: Ribonuclease P protein component [Alphaproteobacteria bacterium MarineAlpha12_Bin1]|tara:strand:- start:5329 stop:5766 length:438 start_codon:yes stop_codon:yes gene_type:complete
MSYQPRINSVENKEKKLPSIKTLKMRSDFIRIASKKRYWSTPGLTLQVSETPRETYDKSVIRIGYTASKKVGNAVKRNRARRRLRETVRKLMPFQAETGNDFVIIARSETVSRPFQDLLSDLELSLKKLDVWNEPVTLHNKKDSL